MNPSQLLKKSNDFRCLAQTPQGFDVPLAQVFDDQLLTFIATSATGKFKREELNSYIRTNKTMLEHMKRNITWKGKSERDGLYGIDRSGNYALLTKHTNPPKEYKTKSASILKGISPIPTLYLFVMEEEEFEPRAYPKELGHYSFIMQAFIQMFPALKSESKEQFTSNIFEFVETNKTAIDKLRRRFTHEPTYINAGSDGAVFIIGPDRILKLFKDASAYRAAVDAMGRVFKGHQTGKTEAYVDDAGMLGTFYDSPVYYYVQERMETLTDLFADDLDAGGYMGEILKEVKDEFYRNKPILERLRKLVNHPRMPEATKTIATRIAGRVKRYIADRIKYVEAVLGDRVRQDWFERLVEEMVVKYATGRTDLHMGNIGLTGNGLMRYFDPAFMEPTEPPGEGLEYDMLRV